MKFAIAIFVKTPGVSPLKTRLAATVGTEKAIEFYQQSLKCIINTLQNVDITPHWAVAEKESLDNPLWSNFNRLHTGEGGLGERQSYIYHELLKTHDGVLLIGGDAPQISEKIIQQAMLSLEGDNENKDYVIGPANDGGYYLFGGRKPVASEVWSSTPWSHEKTRETFIAQLDSKPTELNSLTDVDTEEDLQTIIVEMPERKNQQQLALINWINNSLN